MRHRVTSKGEDIPNPLSSFEELELEPRFGATSLLLQNLHNHGFTSPTPIQAHGIPILLKVRLALIYLSQPSSSTVQKRDLAAISPTGTGKTLSYLIPIMTCLKDPISKLAPVSWKGARAVVVAPTRELAHQIHNECLKLSQGRKWRIVLLSKATASTLANRAVRDKIGEASP